MDIIGIDISKQWFDSYCLADAQSNRYSNDLEGFAGFFKQASADIHVVMEATGPYYLRLATWLYEQGCRVSVINPLVIRCYGQMQLARTKQTLKTPPLLPAMDSNSHRHLGSRLRELLSGLSNYLACVKAC